ncbi:hypothetical protein MUU45_001117 [Rodentibacter pneumotropicus]|uniref:Uncharacterized protein n=1 Tax=Rodentibacter pneumotropicus TaxID=758 RepID=A0AAW5LDE7_9PAST|nr:hypothetical protein [Rodentibacter pneumotropicus]
MGKLLESLVDDLLDYAKSEFELDKKPKGSDATNREHLQAIQEATGKQLSELNHPLPDEMVRYLLDYFYEIALSRQYGMACNPILYAEIESWCRLTQRHLAQWELEVIKRLDMLWLQINVD